MQVSIWLYLLQQTLLIRCLFAALQRAVHLPAAPGVRLWGAALLMGTGDLLSVMQQEATLHPFPAILSALAPLAVWPGIPQRLRLRVTLVFVSLTLLLSGWARLLASSGLPVPLLTPLCCLLIVLLPSLLQRDAAITCAAVQIVCGQGRLRLTALVDSGNLLRDRISGLPVIVISRSAAHRLTGAAGGSALPCLRQIPVRTVSGTATMSIFRPDLLLLDVDGRWYQTDAMIGLAPDGYDGFQALVPTTLLTRVAQTVNHKEEQPLCP